MKDAVVNKKIETSVKYTLNKGNKMKQRGNQLTPHPIQRKKQKNKELCSQTKEKERHHKTTF